MAMRRQDKPAGKERGEETLPATSSPECGGDRTLPAATPAPAASAADQTIPAPPPGDCRDGAVSGAAANDQTVPDPRQISGMEATVHGAGAEPGAAHTLPSADVAVPRGAAAGGGATGDTLTAEHPGRYERRDRLGAGGIGEVVLALDRHLGREVAVKELRRELRSEGGATGGAGGGVSRTVAEVRFLEEARVTARLEHPGVVPIYELGQHADETLYYTMKVVRGQTLRDAMEGRDVAGRLALLPCFIAVCDAVAYAHSRGVVHRDLKPENVMLGDFGETVVLDWGLAKVRAGEGGADAVAEAGAALAALAPGTPASATVAGAPIGTPAYMAPEQARGALAEIAAPADVYALGVMLYELLTGRRPFEGETIEQLITQALMGRVVPPSQLERRCPPELEAVALRALQRDPARRYPDARALAADVRAFQTGGLVGAHRYSAAALIARWVRRHRALLAATLVVALAVAGAWWYRGHAEHVERAAAELARQNAVLREVTQILAETARGGGKARWLDTYTLKLVSLKEPAVERQLIAAISHPNKRVRALVARVLGGMRSRPAVAPLVARLRERGGEPDEEVLIEVINALGLVGDARADRAVDAARWRFGQHGPLWKATELAYRMIPIRPLADGGASLSANEWTDRGRALDNKGRTRAALQAYDRAVARDPQLTRAYVNRGIVRKRLGDLRGALQDYDRALKLNPKGMAARHNRAILRRALGDYAGAIADYDVVIADGEHALLALRNRAVTRRDMGDLRGAVTDAQAAIKAQPRSTMGYKVLAQIWLRFEQADKALAAVDRALAMTPKDSWALIYRAAAQSMLGRRAAARSSLERALEVDPTNWVTWGRLAALHMELMDDAAAKGLLDRGIELAREEGVRWILRAVIYHTQRGELRRALGDLRVGVEGAYSDMRTLGRVFALAVAARLGDAAVRDEMLGALRAERTVGWRAHLARAASGEEPLERLQAEARSDPGRRCDVALVAGLRAELAGERTGAREAYARAATARRPPHLSCVLARALSGAPRAGTGLPISE